MVKHFGTESDVIMKTRAWDGERFRLDYIILPNGKIMSLKWIEVGSGLYPWLTEVDWKLSRLYENHMNINQEIWEHDIVKCKVLGSGEHIGTVVFVDGCFDVQFQYPIKFLDGVVRDRYYVKCFTVNHAIGVIGNIFQNPELLEEVK